MAIHTRDLTRDWRPGDAQRLARFWNATGRGWPGGTWDPQTPEEAERGVREENLLGAFVTEVGGKIVSFCNLVARPDQRNRAYVPFLTADPDFHGKGYGKAVLVRAVERTYELGIGCVDLGTWPGNLKAVPLYKKSGFMWSPESGAWGVHMENYTPGARRHPVAQAFFRRHDWYRTMKRDLSLVPDEHKRGKVRVYRYEWEQDGDRLCMVYDRQSWGLLEIETNDFLVGCFLDDEKLVAGLPQGIRWQIVNHRDRPLDVVLMGSADEGVKLERKESLRVSHRAELEAEFEIDAEMEEKEREPRVPIIRTELLVDGRPISLAAGFQVKQPLHFSLDGDGQGLRPGRAERVVLQVWNELDRRVRANARMSGPPGLSLEPTGARLEVPAKGSAEVPVTVTAAEPGPFAIRLESEVRDRRRTVRSKAADLWVHALRPGEAVGHVEKDRVVLESATLRVNIWRRGGWLGVTDKVRNRWNIVSLGPPQVGPPFTWDEFFQTRAEARVDQEGGRATAVLTTDSICRPGVRLERRIGLSSAPLIEIHDTLLNTSSSPLEGRLAMGVRLSAHGGAVAAPTADGIVRAPLGSAGRSLGEHHLSDRGEDWPEGWFAFDDREGVTNGLLWDRAERIEARGGWNSLQREFPAAAPGHSTTPGPIYLFVGEGDHFTVRRWWQALFGPRVDREQRRAETRPPLEFGLRPRPLVVHGGEAEAKLAVEPIGRLELSGRLQVKTPPGLRVRPSRMDFQGVSGKRARTRRATIERTRRLPEGAYAVECSLRLDRAIYRERQVIVALGDPGRRVKVARRGKAGAPLEVANGLLTLTVAPGFQGSAVSLKRGGEELLRSAYPEARPLAWNNPWFGGIQPRLGSLSPRDLLKEGFRAREIERRGGQGIVWRGVRVACTPRHERARNDGLALDYLLAPGSGIMAVCLRTRRRAHTAGWLDGSFELWPVLGGSWLDATLRGSADSRTSRVCCEFGGGVRGGPWVMAENPKTGDAVVLAGPGGEASTHGQVVGRDGYVLTASSGATHEARETRECVFFLSVTEADRARELAEALSAFRGLP
jgi:ribosomal protein S18 acetylase RimI-like enzyme